MSGFAETRAAMAAERAALLERLEQGLQGDERVVAAWIGGSIGRGEADELSDIDIHLAVSDAHCPELNAQRRAFVAGFGEVVLAQEAPQNAPPEGAFQLVLYRGISAPIEVDWSWRPASAAAIPERAVVLFDRTGGLPRAPSSVALSQEETARRISLNTSFFWAMAFIAAKKIARGQPAAAFGLMRMMHSAVQSVRENLAARPLPTWGSIASPHEPLPPTNVAEQTVYLAALLADMAALHPTTDGEGGLVTADAVAAIGHFVDQVAEVASAGERGHAST
jgi:predicted nucleotidyltransferase